MIIFFESGRLGNQLFQYCAMRKFQPEGTLLVIGMRELKTNFCGINFLKNTAWNRTLRRIVARIGKQRFEFIANKLRLLTLVDEERTTSGVEFHTRNGLFRSIVYFKEGYFQAEDMVDETIASQIELNKNIRDRANEFLNQYPVEMKNRYFVHIRRGDYVHWPSREAPAVMPLRWYVEQMERIRQTNPNAVFFVTSDDKPYVEEFVSNSKDSVSVNLDVMEDFAVMTKCGGGGVLSASSYAWWASYFAGKENPRAYFIAPMYWLGYRRSQWFPKGIQTSWIQYES